MEFFCVFDNNIKNSSVCCDLVFKNKQYVNLLQVESSRLSNLQVECNELLDKFYPLKSGFDCLIKETLPTKYIFTDNHKRNEECFKEFVLFIKNVWQLGKYKFLEKGKVVQYISLTGNPLVDVLTTIQSFVDEVMVRVTYMPYHSDCVAALHLTCNQIYTELHRGCLSTADACVRQYVYLQSAIPFLHQLKSLMDRYLVSPEILSPKEFFVRIILQLPCVEEFSFKEDTKDTMPFRFLVDLLTGKLLDDKVLDQHSDIRPVVDGGVNLERNKIVIDTVGWIMQQYKSETVPKAFRNFVYTLTVPEVVERKRYFQVETNHFHSRSAKSLNPSQLEIFDLIENFDIPRNQMVNNRRSNKRGRKPEFNNNARSISNDLQPINIQTLQSPILLPLF